MLMIRLARRGARKQPHYRIVVIEKARARNGRPVEVVGTYNPRTNPASVEARSRRVLGVEGRSDVGAREQTVHQDFGSGCCRLRRLRLTIGKGTTSSRAAEAAISCGFSHWGLNPGPLNRIDSTVRLLTYD